MTYFDLQMQSTRSLYRPEDMLSTVRMQCEMLPEYLPQKFGWSEPLKEPFNLDRLDALIPSHSDGRAESVWWKRFGNHRATGSWLNRWEGKLPSTNTHAAISLTVSNLEYQEKLIAYLKAGCVHNQCDLGFLDGITERYRCHARKNELAPFGGSMSIATHVLRHWLPDILWATVLGPAYVRMFGKKRVLTAPAHTVCELGPETIYLQLTAKLADVEDDFEKVMSVRDRVKQHLGLDAFFQSDKAYDWREHPEMAGKVFQVPEFHLLSD